MTKATPPRFLFLLSSARAGGNSAQLAHEAAAPLACPYHSLDLATLLLPAFVDPRPAPPARPTDDLARVLGQMRRATDLCFVAPVYWYALPAPAKLLLDHWLGFLDLKGLGFPLWIRTKRLWLITTRADPDPTVAEPSEAMVQRTAQWLGMAWGSALHGRGGRAWRYCAPRRLAACARFFLHKGRRYLTWRQAQDPLISDLRRGSCSARRSINEQPFLADRRADGASETIFSQSHGKPRVDDRRVLSGIIFINRNGLRWCDALKEYSPHKTLYNRWKRWSDMGVFARIMTGLAIEGTKTIMIDATYLKAHRTASSLRVKKGGLAV